MLKSPAFSTSFLESRMIQKLKSRKSRIKPGLFAFLLAGRIIFGKKTQKTGENTGFSPVFFLHVLYGNGVHSGSDTWFSHPFAPVPNRCHPLKHPKRTRLQLFSPEIGCVSLFLPSFDLQKFRAGFSQTSGLSSHSYRFILTRPFPDAMIRIPAFLS